MPEDELGEGDCNDSIVDPEGHGPRIWFQQVPEAETVKNRLHLDVKVGGKRAPVRRGGGAQGQSPGRFLIPPESYRSVRSRGMACPAPIPSLG
ncbi:VOC family protein [Nonomuraea sp. NPDC001831]|uniref:VOC family protein n=1 Tax=Nonomuraea sp. NPDC001831 TaxID=3364340 RepID=UPI00369E5B2E